MNYETAKAIVEDFFDMWPEVREAAAAQLSREYTRLRGDVCRLMAERDEAQREQVAADAHLDGVLHALKDAGCNVSGRPLSETIRGLAKERDQALQRAVMHDLACQASGVSPGNLGCAINEARENLRLSRARLAKAQEECRQLRAIKEAALPWAQYMQALFGSDLAGMDEPGKTLASLALILHTAESRPAPDWRQDHDLGGSSDSYTLFNAAGKAIGRVQQEIDDYWHAYVEHKFLSTHLTEQQAKRAVEDKVLAPS